MENVERGIVAVIANHSWIYNPTFRGMRRSLMRSFQKIYLLDLHGSTKPREAAPNGSRNENVFDITKGVAVAIFVKDSTETSTIRFEEVWGSRLEKYKACANMSLMRTAFVTIEPTSPYYFFSPHTSVIRSTWPNFTSLGAIFTMQTAGMLSARDNLNIAFETAALLGRLTEFCSLDPEEARTRFKLRKDKRDWAVRRAQADVRNAGLSARHVKEIDYRPFDSRFVFYTGQSKGLIGQPAKPLSDAIQSFGLALGTTKRVEEGPFRHAFVFSLLPDGHSVSSKETTHVFPLYVTTKGGRSGAKSLAENLSVDFRTFLDARYDHHYSPEEILGYIYAVLHAPTYRTRYAEFLRTDFPRIPFTEKPADFDVLSKLGWALVQAHLLKSLPRKGLADFKGKGDRIVEKPRYSPEEQAIWINKDQHFRPAPPEVWNFHIGGYQVLDKYLKSRKGRVLSLDEINHVAAVADSLAFTIDQMGKIDTAYLAAFPDRA